MTINPIPNSKLTPIPNAHKILAILETLLLLIPHKQVIPTISNKTKGNAAKGENEYKVHPKMIGKAIPIVPQITGIALLVVGFSIKG